MGWHIIKRLLQAVPVLLGIATITFFIIHLPPANQRELVAHKHPPIQPHFHEKISTTHLQPERPLSRNLKKF
jgi:ABC-type dipeptide/oligopeptide/nickel transport system permease component